MKAGPRYTNSLINETSPYLLQHAHNPVNWMAWNANALEKARSENKLMIISIGYSACHWCHVMEHESFEDEGVAEIMNERFICIKVDREERPDIDQIYMQAVQLMTGHGGWPLNCITMPDGRPIYGGTYFRKDDWKSVLLQVSDFFYSNREKCEEYAEHLTEGIKKSEPFKINVKKPEFSMDLLKITVETWKGLFDKKEGGPDKFPKFPLPNNYLFLLRYYDVVKDEEILQQINLTLTKMAYGGIYDQLGGGFARYSVDSLWKVPHFEKMLYDNGQMVSLYSEAYQLTKQDLYKETVYETIAFVNRELSSPEGGFYSALDADSEGEEGKFYIWKKQHLETILGERFTIFSDYYNVNSIGYWEHDNYILIRKKSDEEIARKYNFSVPELKTFIRGCKNLLMETRAEKVRPGLDDKQITSWNALMLKGLTDAYFVFRESSFLERAVQNAEFILTALRREDGGLYHTYKNGKSSINGYLEDYAFTIEAFISLYEVSGDERWIKDAEALMNYTITHFYDKLSGMFFFTSDLDPALIARKMEIYDNVIPSSNSAIAKCLFLLSLHLGNSDYRSMSEAMVNNVKNDMPQYGSGYSNWAITFLNLASPFYEVVIAGPQAKLKEAGLSGYYLPRKIVAFSDKETSLPLFQERMDKEKTLVYVCENFTCNKPVNDIEEAIVFIK